MSKAPKGAMVVTICLFLASSSSAGLHAQTSTARLNDLLDTWNVKNGPGMAAMLIRNGRIEYQKTFGFADLEARKPIRPDTQFLLASLTKQFTAMAILMLVERQKLRLEDSLAALCPEFPPYARTITIRNLLNHTAGLTQYQELLIGKVPENYFRSSKSPPAPHEFTAAEALQVLSRQGKLRFSPGQRFEYSDSAYVVLAQIIERITGERYAEFLKKMLFNPLAMKDTMVVDERKQRVPRLALAYVKGDDGWKDITYSPENSIYGEDGIYSTIEDLYKWDQALYTERLVTRATLEMAFTPGLAKDGQEARTDMLARPSSYGFGWFISSLKGEKSLEHP
jgi:CubicO group peptidase (beta-lactamase class C family)